MSLYNLMNGNNPLYAIFARIVETQGPLEPARFRDMYLRESNGVPQIVLYTRTGGGNRDEYESENAALAAHPLFVEDFDDDYDSTFAHFVYSVPEQLAPLVKRLHGASCRFPKFAEPREKQARSLASIQGKADAIEPPSDDELTELMTAINELVAQLPQTESRLEQVVR